MKTRLLHLLRQLRHPGVGRIILTALDISILNRYYERVQSMWRQPRPLRQLRQLRAVSCVSGVSGISGVSCVR